LKPLVSIIIPCYNGASFLGETIESALNQSYKETEILIIDDGSTDDSYKIAKSFTSKNVIVLRKENGGASSARNFGFMNSNGNYVQFLDSDDLLAIDKIEKQVNLIAGSDEDCIISGSFSNLNEPGKRIEPMKLDTGCKDFDQPIEWLIEAAFGRAMFPPVVWLTPRKLIEQAGQWDEKLSYNDDPEFFARVLLKSKGILFCKDSISYYRRGVSSSLGSRKDRKARESELESLNLVTDHMLEYENSLRVREACSYRYRKLIYSLYPEHKDLINIAEDKIRLLDIVGDYDFGNGITNKLGKIVGWKNSKLIRQGYNRLSKYF
jgi:glycosyltransferase involved in cell wall biosynthesis